MVHPPRGGGLGRTRPVPGRRGRQGHGHLLRPGQRPQRRVSASGSEMPSRPAARAATTTRPWASRPGAPGWRSAATSTSSGSTCRPIRSGWRASATCPATCSATACCRARPSGWWRPSTTATSSSTPTRTRQRRSPSGPAWPPCPRRAGPTTARSSSPTAAGSGPVTPRRSRWRRPPGGPWASPPRTLSPPELIVGHPGRAGRPAVVRRHRHLRQGSRGAGQRRRRSRQRRRPHHLRPGPGPGGRRRRQPRGHPAGPDPLLPPGRADQRRLHRQRRRRGHLRPGGQPARSCWRWPSRRAGSTPATATATWPGPSTRWPTRCCARSTTASPPSAGPSPAAPGSSTPTWP